MHLKNPAQMIILHKILMKNSLMMMMISLRNLKQKVSSVVFKCIGATKAVFQDTLSKASCKINDGKTVPVRVKR